MAIFNSDPTVASTPALSFGNVIARGTDGTRRVQINPGDFRQGYRTEGAYTPSEAETAGWNEYVAKKDSYGNTAPVINDFDQYRRWLDYNEATHGQRAPVYNAGDSEAFYNYLKSQPVNNTPVVGNGYEAQVRGPVRQTQIGEAPAGEYEASNRFAKINREMYEDYKKRFAPLEKELVGIAQSGDKIIKDSAQGAMDSVDPAYQKAKDISVRNASRQGITLDPRQAAEYHKGLELEKGLSKVNAYNTMYDAEKDRMTRLTQDMIAIGRGIKSDSNAGFQQAANMADQRRATNRSIEAQDDGGGGFLGTIIGAGLSKL